MATSATIHLVTDPPRVGPPSGLETSGGEWRLDLARYAPFVEFVTGHPVSTNLSNSDCYRIRNRLEALVAEHYRTGEWPSVVQEAASDTVRPEDIFELARFFRFYADSPK